MFTVSCFFVGGEQSSASICVNAEHYVSTDSLIFVDFSFDLYLYVASLIVLRLFEVVFILFLVINVSLCLVELAEMKLE